MIQDLRISAPGNRGSRSKPSLRLLRERLVVTTRRTTGWILEDFFFAGSLFEHRSNNLRNYIAGAFDDNHVANANILATNIVSIVQRRELDGDPAQSHRLKHRVRVHRARAADVDADLLQPGRRNLTRKLESDRPTRVAAHRAEERADNPDRQP